MTIPWHETTGWNFKPGSGVHSGTVRIAGTHDPVTRTTTITQLSVQADEGGISRAFLETFASELHDLADKAAARAAAAHRSEGVLKLTSPDGTVIFEGRAVVGFTDESQAQRLYQAAAKRRRLKLTPEELRLVAHTYQAAAESGEPRIKAVAAAMFKSESRAAHLIKQAREQVDPETGQPYLEPKEEK